MKPKYLLLSLTVYELCSQWHGTEALDMGDCVHFDDESDQPKFPRFQKILFEKYGLGTLYKLLVERIGKPPPPVHRSEIIPKLKFLRNRIEVLLNVTSYMDPDDKLSILPSLSILVHMLRPEFKKVSFKVKVLKNKRKFLKENLNNIISLRAKIEDVLSKLECDIDLCKKIAYSNMDKG